MWRRRVRAGDVRYGCTPIPGRLELPGPGERHPTKVERPGRRRGAVGVATRDREPGRAPDPGPAMRTRRAGPPSRGPVRSGPASRAAVIKTVTVRRAVRGSTLPWRMPWRIIPYGSVVLTVPNGRALGVPKGYRPARGHVMSPVRGSETELRVSCVLRLGRSAVRTPPKQNYGSVSSSRNVAWRRLSRGRALLQIWSSPRPTRTFAPGACSARLPRLRRSA